MKSPLPPMVHRLTACLALATFFPSAAPAQRPTDSPALRPAYDQWTTYLNPRLAYQIPVPPGLRAQSDPRKGSSCRFASDDGGLVLRVWGNPLGRGPGDPLENAWREAVNLRGRRLDFQRRAPQSFVLAGVTADGMEFFEKVILGSGATAGFNIAYPPSEVRRFSGVVDEVERGFGWHPEAPPVSSGSPPPRGFFSGVREYFTGEPYPGTAGNERDTPVPSAIPRDPSQTKVDLTPPPDRPGGDAANLPLEKTTPPAVPKPAPAKREDLPYGISIPGKKGYVYSPFGDTKQQVDVTDIPTGTKVKCPYTGKVFRVP